MELTVARAMARRGASWNQSKLTARFSGVSNGRDEVNLKWDLIEVLLGSCWSLLGSYWSQILGIMSLKSSARKQDLQFCRFTSYLWLVETCLRLNGTSFFRIDDRPTGVFPFPCWQRRTAGWNGNFHRCPFFSSTNSIMWLLQVSKLLLLSPCTQEWRVMATLMRMYTARRYTCIKLKYKQFDINLNVWIHNYILCTVCIYIYIHT